MTRTIKLPPEPEFVGVPSIPPELAPSCDMEETDSHFLLSFDLPGVRKEDVRLNLLEDVLTVSGERKDDCKERGTSHYHAEHYYGPFARSLTLPPGVRSERIEAEFSNGVLSVRIPKGAASKPREIKISKVA